MSPAEQENRILGQKTKGPNTKYVICRELTPMQITFDTDNPEDLERIRVLLGFGPTETKTQGDNGPLKAWAKIFLARAEKAQELIRLMILKTSPGEFVTFKELSKRTEHSVVQLRAWNRNLGKVLINVPPEIEVLKKYQKRRIMGEDQSYALSMEARDLFTSLLT